MLMMESIMKNSKQWGTDPFSSEICTFFVPVLTFPPFFCANNYYTSMLLIVCTLRWYVKSLYRHFFLEDISKHARVIKKMHLLIYNTSNYQAPWATDPKLVLWLPTSLSCDMAETKFFLPWSNVELWLLEEAGLQMFRGFWRGWK